MPKEYSRAERVASLVQRNLAELISREIKDPRLPMFVTITEVKVSRDLAYAKVFIRFVEENVDTKVAIEVLNGASGFLRGLLGRQLTTRTVPKLQFVYDESIDYGDRLSKLIDKAVADHDTSDEDK